MLITLADISIRYGDRPVLSRVDCSMSRGEFVVVMGPSGSGKTTLLGIVGGVVRPDSGKRLVSGSEPNVAWISQVTVLHRRRTAQDNVAIGAYRVCRTINQARNSASDALSVVGVERLALQRAATLSGGEQQRVAVARALAGRPDLLLADEPTASLDTAARERLLDSFCAVADAGVGVLIATHDPAVAARASRVWVIQDGTLAESAD